MTVTTPNSARPGTNTPAPGSENTTVECTLDIGGMTCASCVGRVEKALNRVDGVVTATVNLANETAVVTYEPQTTSTQTMTEAVVKAGYTGTPRPTAAANALGLRRRERFPRLPQRPCDAPRVRCSA